MSVYVPEEKLFKDDMIHDFERHSSQNEYARQFDRVLNKATNVQGWTSGFFAMRRIQQRIAVTSAADKIARHFNTGEKLISADRLRDMGLDGNDIAAIRKYVQNGTVKFDKDGNLTSLGINSWDARDAEMFAMTLNSNVNTLVQKAMAGESSTMFHRDGVASLFWHLKSFPMLAIEKQTLRQARMADQEAIMTFVYGLATAAAAYSAKQVINGREENLTFDKITRQAIGMSNMAGWVPMFTDPLAGMLGIDALKLGGYGGFGGNNVITTPAALPTLDRMLQIPGALKNSLLYGPSNADINALTATPLVGNAYIFASMFNAIKDDNNQDRKEATRVKAREDKKKEAEESKKTPPKEVTTPLEEVLGTD